MAASKDNPGASNDCRVADLLALKAAGKELTEDQIMQLVRSITENSMDQTQLGAFLMAVFINGMSKTETVVLTKAMLNSGGTLKWPKEWIVGDKHSTGGVGDKVSIPLTPALAACGLKVPMISGRGLAHTGGTLDKLESIPGLNVSLSREELHHALQSAGCVIAGQTGDLVPADKRMYAVRDVTATVASTPLIVSSILSKKAAEGLSCLVLDVKCGAASFMKTPSEAEGLARSLVETMGAMGVTTTALITAMDHPIGRTIGNALEVRESLDCLMGGGPPDLQELVVALGGELLTSANLCVSVEEGRNKILATLKDGTALAAFENMIVLQGVDEQTARRLCTEKSSCDCLPKAKHTTPVCAKTSGTITEENALALAEVSAALGAGRERAGEPIDYDVGIVLDKVVGERVEEGQAWATLHHKEESVPEALLSKVQQAVVIDPKMTPFDTPSRVIKRITATSLSTL